MNTCTAPYGFTHVLRSLELLDIARRNIGNVVFFSGRHASGGRDPAQSVRKPALKYALQTHPDETKSGGYRGRKLSQNTVKEMMPWDIMRAITTAVTKYGVPLEGF